MRQVRVRAVRWVSDDNPGFVECRLVDADGREHALIDKAPVLDVGDVLRPDTTYPINISIDCRVVREDGDSVVIELAYHVESVDGQGEFRVARHLLV
jgi:predicted HD phosphohydrolase